MGKGQRSGATVDSVSLFISYSHKDEVMRLELEPFLIPLEEEKLVSSWHDGKIPAGAVWDKEIDTKLQSADIIILLMSQDFLASKYIRNVELPEALRRHRNGEARVIPVILRTFSWASSPVRDLQSVPRNKNAVNNWPDRDAAYVEVIEAIRQAANDLFQLRRAEAELRETALKQYRQKVEEVFADGVIQVGGRDTLDELQEKLEPDGLSPEDAERIVTEAQLPIKQNSERMENYRKTLLKHIEQEYPLSELQRKDLNLRQRDLGLKEDDAAKVEAPILAKAEEDHQARLAEEQRKAEDAARLEEEQRKAEDTVRLAEEQRKAEDAARLEEVLPAARTRG